jgi:hypothetical protein
VSAAEVRRMIEHLRHRGGSLDLDEVAPGAGEP